MIRRAAIVVVVALVVVTLLRVDIGTHRGLAAAPTPPHPSLTASGAGSTWYCPAGGAGGPDPLVHRVVVTNPDRRPLHARVSGYLDAPAPAVARNVTVPPLGRVEVKATDLAAGVGGMVVELLDGRGTVSHRLSGLNADEISRCTDAPATSWYFAAADTELASAATLWLLNPSPIDATVSVSIATPDGVRVPPSLESIVVAAGSSRHVDLGPSAQRRPQFAFGVTAKSGQVVAELAQYSDATGGLRGLRLQMGVSDPGERWLFADGFGGDNASEQLVVYNTEDDAVHASISVVPAGIDASSLPEPFELDVPAHRFTVLDLDEETRLPDTGLRWIGVEASGAVVAERLVTMLGEGGDGTATTRPRVRTGLANSTGSSVTSHEWIVDGIDPASDSQSVVLVTNPSPDPDTIAVVQLEAIVDGAVTKIGDRVEVQAGTTLAVDVSAAFPTEQGAVRVRSQVGVVVEARSTSGVRHDLSVIAGVPAAADAEGVPSLDRGTR